MRKSTSSSGFRRARAGIVVGAVATLLLGAIAAPAYATSAITVLPTAGVTGQSGTITATGTGGLFASSTGTPGALFTTANTCPATYTTTAPAGGVIATATKSSVDVAVINLPLSLTPNVYSVCLYATNVAASALASTGGPATYTVTPAAVTLNTVSGVPGAVSTITATSTNGSYLTGAVAPVGVNFSVASCGATYTTPSAGTVLAATATKTATVATITMPTGLLAGTTYNVCIYAGNVNASSKLLGTSTYNATAPAVTLNTATGPSAGGNTITASALTGIFADVVTLGVNFATGVCPATYTASPANRATTATSTSAAATFTVPTGVVVGSSPYRVCLYDGTDDAVSPLVGGTATASYTVALPVITLSATTGKTGGTNTITGQASVNFLTGVSAPGVAFVVGTCPTTYTVATNLTATGQRIALNRFAVTVPTGVTAPAEYKVCVYDGAVFTSSALLASAPSYTAATATSLASVSPAGGPAQGGSTITVTGAGFPDTIDSASLGGTPLTDIVRTSATTFTAVTPPHLAATNLTLSVTTSAGTFTLKNAFTYTNGISVSPNTAPQESPSVDVYVVGAGFTEAEFSTTSSDAHIYLVDGVYNAADNGGQKTNGPLAECGDVLVIGDTELICKMKLDIRLDEAGIPAVIAARVVADGATGTGTTFTSATANFTSADVGLGLSVAGNLEVASGTTIVAVTSPTTVTLSSTVLDDGETGLTTTIGAARSVTAITTVDGSTTITGVAGKFLPTDVGRQISGAGIAAGTTIATVATGGATATLSVAAGVGAGAGAVAVSAAAPVPDGAYTMTFVTNGDIDAATDDSANYSQSIVTSGSTFTVSDY